MWELMLALFLYWEDTVIQYKRSSFFILEVFPSVYLAANLRDDYI